MTLMLQDQIIANAWNDLEMYLETENNCDCKNTCSHKNAFYDPKEGVQICNDCCEVISCVFDTCEWNHYKKDDGSFQQNNQRADAYISDNPYDLGGSIPGFNKNSFIMRLHYQNTFSHKQKTFWQISEKFQEYITSLGISVSVLPDAKNMWHICMESGKLTRASVRNGLISACLYYSCIHNNIPVERQKLIDMTEGNQKGFLKGEKIFLEIMDDKSIYKNLGKEKIDVKENDSFIKFCNILELPFNVSSICNEIYTDYIEKLDSVTPKSIIAGILYYVIKNKLKLSKPSKTKISQVTNVCIPTINKVINILEN